MSRRFYFVSDLDGTLLDQTTSLSPETVRTVNAVLSAGHVFTFSTARSITSARRVTEGVEWPFPVMVYNGALTVELNGENEQPRIVDHRLLTEEITAQIITLGAEHGLSPLLYMINDDAEETVYHLQTNDGVASWFLDARQGDPRFHQVESLTVPEGFQAVLLNFMGREDVLRPLCDQIMADWHAALNAEMFPDTYEPDIVYLEICHQEANKGDALERWGPLVDCTPADVIAFGDNLNDLELLRRAGIGVAVANAHPAVAQVADQSAGNHHEDGVAAYVRRLLSLEADR